LASNTIGGRPAPTGGIDEAIGNVGYYLQQQFQFFDRSLIMIRESARR
jgi:hypothetical protein